MNIFKYLIDPLDKTTINVPFDSEVLGAANQNEGICVWIKQGDGPQEAAITFHALPTGKNLAVDVTCGGKPKFLNTVLLADGQFVQHVFYTGDLAE